MPTFWFSGRVSRITDIGAEPFRLMVQSIDIGKAKNRIEEGSDQNYDGCPPVKALQLLVCERALDPRDRNPELRSPSNKSEEKHDRQIERQQDHFALGIESHACPKISV
jgi:hypothetical protein